MPNEANELDVVIDTNVWLSAIVFGGKPRQILRLFLEETIRVTISEELLSELRRKISQKFPLYIPHLGLLESSLREDAAIVRLGARSLHVCRDPDDDKVIETALAGNCRFILSGDKDLLAIGDYLNIKIIKPAEFLEIIKARPAE